MTKPVVRWYEGLSGSYWAITGLGSPSGKRPVLTPRLMALVIAPVRPRREAPSSPRSKVASPHPPPSIVIRMISSAVSGRSRRRASAQSPGGARKSCGAFAAPENHSSQEPRDGTIVTSPGINPGCPSRTGRVCPGTRRP
jgi:hypothetical protein